MPRVRYEITDERQYELVRLVKEGKVYKRRGQPYQRFEIRNDDGTVSICDDNDNGGIRRILQSISYIDDVRANICDHCGKVILFNLSLLEQGIDETLCSDCINELYKVCDRCHKYHRITQFGITNSGAEYCTDCLSEQGYQRCLGCGKWFLANMLIDGRCDDCTGLRQTILGYHNYSNNYEYIPQFAKDENISYSTFGIELEVIGSLNTSGFVTSRYGDIYHCESDGSLDGRGYEIISQPLSMARWLETYERNKEMLKRLIDRGVRGDEASGAGLHIHVDRHAFKNRNAIYRTLAIVNGLKNSIEILGRRTSNTYCHYYDFNNSRIKTLYSSSCDHYAVVNVRNQSTIEFRFPKSSLNINTICATLELIKNIIDVANSTKQDVSIRDLINGTYISGYAQNRVEMRNLNLDHSVSLEGISTEGLDDELDEGICRHEKVVY